MTVDVATLVFEFKSDSAAQAEKAMDRLIEKGDRLDVAAKKVRLATDRVSEGHRTATSAAETAARGAMGLAAAEGAVEKAARASATASAATRQARQLEAAAMREMVQASKAYERDQARAAKEAARASAALDAQIQSATRGHGALNGTLIRNVGVSRAATQAGLNLSRQAADLGVQFAAAAASAHPLQMIMMSITQQGPQIGDALTTAKTQGVGFGAAMKSLGVMLGLVRTVLPPVIAAELELATAQQAAAASALEAAVAERTKAAGTAQAAEADAAAAAAATALTKANDAVAVSATRAAAAETAMLTPLAVALGAVAAVAAVAFGGAALAARDLNKENKHLVDGLGLTQKQLDHLKDKGVNTAVTIGDVFKGTWNFILAGAGSILAPIGKWFSELFDTISKGAVGAVKAIVGGFAYAFAAVKSMWSNLPSVLGDVMVSTANVVIKTVEDMINRTIDSYNKMLPLIRVLMTATGNVAGASALREGAQFKAQQLANPYAGATAKAASDANAAGKAAAIEAANGVDGVLTSWGKAILKANADRVRKLAGDAGKTPKGPATPRDMTDERTAQIGGMLAQAMQDELQARLAITREARDRADIERQIAAAALQEKQAQVDKQIANIQYDVEKKKLSDAAGDELLAQLELVKLLNERAARAREQAITEAMNAQLAKEANDSQRAALENQIDLLDAQSQGLQSAFARNLVEAEILKAQQQIERLKQEEIIASKASTAAQVADAQARLATLSRIHALELEHLKRETRLVNAIGEATSAVRGFKDAFKRHDWARMFDEFQRTIETIQASFAANGMGGGLMTAGSAAATLIGGKTGRAVGNGLGIAGAGFSAGTALMGAATTGVLGGGAAAGLAMTIAPLLGPIALAAGALYAAAKIFNVGGKPTNAGAGYDLRTGAISGNKRTDETEGAATSAGQAIQGIQDALKAAGIGITDAVTGLVIGTRDATQIYLQSGKTLTSAVGDSGAAVDTAMRALLSSATYVSDAQKKLVDSAVAAGKGFDAVAEILAKYEAAQAISGNLADQILQITDPKAFDLAGVTKDIEAQRKAYQQLANDGFVTADQLTTINGQLATLEGLKLDEVMKRYSDSVQAAANDNEATLATLRSATESAEGMLLDAYNSFAEAKRAEIDGLRQAAAGLKAFRQELNIGAIAGRDPISQLSATRREFERLSAMDASNPERLANLQSVSQAFLEASKIASPTELAFNRDLQAVRRATEASEMAATAQADAAQLQLDAQTAAVSQLITLNATAVSIQAAMAAVLAARANEVAAGGAANDNLDIARYLALNPDLGANWAAGGSLRTAGGTLEEAARAHYATTGRGEIAAGLRTYATGGSHPGGLRLVGEEGPELEATGPARIYSARETARMMGGDNSELVAEVRALRETVAAQADKLREIARNTDQTQSKLKDFEGSGLYVRGEAPNEPVMTEAA